MTETKTAGYRVEWFSDPYKLNANRYQPMRNQSPDKFWAFKQDLIERGIRYPLYTDPDYNIINGHQRHRAWIELLEEGFDLVKMHGPVEIRVSESDHPFRDALLDNTMQRDLYTQEEALIIEYIAREQERLSREGYIGKRKLADGRVKTRFDWSKEGVLSPGNEAVYREFGNLGGARRIARLRRRAEGDGVLEPAEVFIGGDGARLRGEKEDTGRENIQKIPKKGTSADSDTRPRHEEEEVETFTFELPNGEELHAVSRAELDEKIFRYLLAESASREVLIQDKDLAVKEATHELRERLAANYAKHIEQLKKTKEELAEQHQTTREQEQEKWREKNADLLARFGVEPTQTIADLIEEVDLDALWQAFDRSVDRRKKKVSDLLKAIHQVAGSLESHSEYTGEEGARFVLESFVGKPRAYVEPLTYLHEWIGEFLSTIETRQTTLSVVHDADQNKGVEGG